MLKLVYYQGGLESQGQVAYVVVDDKVYFSGTTQHPSTINWAEEILITIAAVERLDWRTLTFFDIQTHRGYASKHSGRFEIDRLTVREEGESPKVQNWLPASCPKEVLDHFLYLIN